MTQLGLLGLADSFHPRQRVVACTHVYISIKPNFTLVNIYYFQFFFFFLDVGVSSAIDNLEQTSSPSDSFDNIIINSTSAYNCSNFFETNFEKERIG